MLRPNRMNELHITHRKWVNIQQISYLVIIFLIILSSLPGLLESLNPYEILGLQTDANQGEIKRAYRELAKKLHPDKSKRNEEEASRKFIELNRAFNILKDPDRKARYDHHGETEESRQTRGYHHASRYQHQNTQTRSEWSNGNGYTTFTFSSSSGTNQLRRRSITTKQYHNEYLKESLKRPFLIFVYNDRCLSCSMIEATWMKIVEELSKHNVGFFTIDIDHERRLARSIGVTSVPYIACLIDGQVHPYHSNEISLAHLVSYIKSLLPSNLVPNLSNEYDQDRFIIRSGPDQNRLCAIIVSNEKNLKLRYLLLAFEMRQYYRFAHISTKLSSSGAFLNKYSVDSSSLPQILVFDEFIKRPVNLIKIDPNSLNASYLRMSLSRWPFLRLPRISSQSKFDDLCSYTIPRDRDRTSRRLCVVLLTSSSPSADLVRSRMIEFIELNHLARDEKVMFSYIDIHKQKDFVDALVSETKRNQPSFVGSSVDFGIILIQRHTEHFRKATYKWLNYRWNPSDLNEIDLAKVDLHNHVTAYKQGGFVPQDKLALPTLLNEDEPSLIDRLTWRLLSYLSRLFYYAKSNESFSALVILVGSACVTSLFLYRSPTLKSYSMDNEEIGRNSSRYRMEERSKLSKTNQHFDDHLQKGSTEFTQDDDELRLIELKAQTLNGMVRLLKPGYRSIVLLLDRETKDRLLMDFRKAVWPYRRNKTLLFGYLCLDKNLEWYKTLLEHVLASEGLKVNKKNCIGTVLSLNGFKKYMRVYHSKHHEIDNYDDETENDGSFLGFDDASDNNDIEQGTLRTYANVEASEFPEGGLLDRLPIWLDKMFDGLTKRYFVDSWPENIK